MTSSLGLARRALLLLAGLILAGCVPSAPEDEEKEPYYLTGKSRVSAMDFKGAIESFEKATEVNPKSAPAHLELGLLYEKEPDPAAAIYHFERYLKLAPNGNKEDMVKPRVLACRQQLAESVYLGGTTEKQRRDLEQLLVENKQLRESVEKWRAYAINLQAATNRSGTPAPPAPAPMPSGLAAVSQTNTTTTVRTSNTSATSQRTHTVKAGETLSLIAKKYGVKLDALMSANPRLDARRLRPGQSVVVPGS
jgi:LysM repeat protein